MALANTITSVVFPGDWNYGKDQRTYHGNWEVIQTAGAFTDQVGNVPIVSSLSSGAWDVRVFVLNASVAGNASTAGSVLVTFARNTIGDLNPGTQSSAGNTGNYTFDPIGMAPDNTSTTATVGLVCAVTSSGFFYAQFGKKAK